MDFLAKELKEAYENYHRKEKMRIHLKHLDFLMDEKRHEIVHLSHIVEEERLDVERIEIGSFKESLRALFIEVLEDKKVQYEAERQEYLQAFLNFEAAKKELKLLEYEKEVLGEKYKRIKYSKRTLNKLLRDRENYLRKTQGKTAEAIFANDKRKNVLTNMIREIEEATAAGEVLFKRLKELKLELEQVKNWGEFVMGGKGRYSSYKKKKYIERNRSEISTINHQVLSYATELKDISIHLDVHFTQFVKAFEDFLNEFYDNLITDWVIKRKIKDTVGGVATLMDKILRINASMQSEKGRSERELKTLDEQLNKIVLREIK